MKKTYQTMLDPHEARLVEEISRKTGCSASAVIRYAAKDLCDRYDKTRR
ncbi:hypothetical protein [Prevotella sp. KH2C16]|nr:hypothetical protein [Prevotella sp. KH2C16]SFF96615.1 hypothetical protein SAMN05216383_10313 [Prevotella sp. KH2C16]